MLFFCLYYQEFAILCLTNVEFKCFFAVYQLQT